MPDSSIEFARLLDIANSASAPLALAIAVCVAVIRWRDVFRSDLRKRQLEELATVRQQLHDIWFELGYLSGTRRMMEINEWNLDDLRDNAPDEWAGYKRYSSCSRRVFYKLQYPGYFLFPTWLDTTRVATLKSSMFKFVPFTLVSSTNPTDVIRRQYLDDILAFIDYLDEQIRKRY